MYPFPSMHSPLHNLQWLFRTASPAKALQIGQLYLYLYFYTVDT